MTKIDIFSFIFTFFDILLVMQTNTDIILPPFLFPGKTSSERKKLGQLKKNGLIKEVAPRLYSPLTDNELKGMSLKCWSQIISHLYPESMISHATALLYRPTEDGEIFLTSTRNRSIEILGLKIKFITGHGPLESDEFFMGMRASSLPRALLENMSTAKAGLKNKIVNPETIEKKLENILLNQKEEGLNSLRDKARKISLELKMEKEYQKLDSIIGAILGTKSIDVLQEKTAKARANLEPYDPNCYYRLELLFAHLRMEEFEEMHEQFHSAQHLYNKAFFESYFSNYIEGTIFEVHEAERIIFDKQIPEERPLDAHDVMGTFEIVSDVDEIRKTPATFEEFKALIKKRHSILMEKRIDLQPGVFKTKVNRAGNTIFVHPAYVEGTLKKGFELYLSLPPGIKRAIFMMFLVADVHPFSDGNGRVARIMMNAELVNQKLPTIIIPNVYREDYISTLKALSRREVPEPFTRMLVKAFKFSNLDFSHYLSIKKEITQKNWFEEPRDAKIIT